VLRVRRVSFEGAITDEWELPNRPRIVSLAADRDDLYIAGGVVSEDYQRAVSEAEGARLDELFDEHRKQHFERQRVLVERLTGRVPEPVLQTNGWIADFTANEQRLLISFGGLAGEPRVGGLALYTAAGELLIERDAGELMSFAGTRIPLRS